MRAPANPDPVLTPLDEGGLVGDGSVDAARILRAALHGSVTPEVSRVGLPWDVEWSFACLVSALARSLETGDEEAAHRAGSPRGPAR